jgi:hypothetical protein
MGKTKSNGMKTPPAVVEPEADGVGPGFRVFIVPNANEFSISNIVLQQNGMAIGNNIDPTVDLKVSGIASPANNSASIQVSILYVDAGQLLQDILLLKITFSVSTGAWSTTIPSAALGTMSGDDGFLEITANGPVPGNNPAAQRPFHVN